MSGHMVQLISEDPADMNRQTSSTGAPFRTEVERGGDASCISLSGTYGTLVPERLEEEIRVAERARVRHLILDLRGLTSVDADGLSALLGDWAGERRDGLVLILVRVPKAMRPLLEQTGLDHQLPISYEGVSLRRPQPAQH
jgi:anti-anti-sigma factor